MAVALLAHFWAPPTDSGMHALVQAVMFRIAVKFRRPDICSTCVQSLGLFTLEAQRWIWERQNPDPALCDQQQFLLGSLIDSAGLGFSIEVRWCHW